MRKTHIQEEEGSGHLSGSCVPVQVFEKFTSISEMAATLLQTEPPCFVLGTRSCSARDAMLPLLF
jgi:hypothetical protein